MRQIYVKYLYIHLNVIRHSVVTFSGISKNKFIQSNPQDFYNKSKNSKGIISK